MYDRLQRISRQKFGNFAPFADLGLGKKRFVHEELGWNFRMSNLQAAVGVAQLERVDDVVKRKRALGHALTKMLEDIPDLQLPVISTGYADNVYWVFGVVLGDRVACDADEAMRRLATMGIGTRPFFWPMHEQPVLRRMGLFDGVSCPVAKRLGRCGFYLPSGAGLRQEQLLRIVEACRAMVAHAA
jgi:perosamine synthetase